MNRNFPQRNKPSFAYIDAIRGIAILMVILTHVGPISVDILPVVASLSAYGRMGVQLFFVASAVTLCMSMMYRQNENNANLKFLIRRFFRIAPAYYLGILVYSVLLSLMNDRPIEFEPMTLHFLFLHGFTIETFLKVVPGGWSIAVEFIFYFIFPFLFIWFVNKPGYKRLFFLAALSFILAQTVRFLLSAYFNIKEDPWSVSYWNFGNQLIVFAIGMITFKFLNNEHRLFENNILVIGLFIGFTATSLLLYRTKPPLHTFFIVMFSGLSFSMLVLFYSKNPIFSPKWLQTVGQVSFSMYLIHFLVVNIYEKSPIYTHVVVEPHLKYLMNYLIIVIVTFALSWASHRFIEKPGISIGKYLTNRI